MSITPLSIRSDQILAALADAYAFHMQRGAAQHYLNGLVDRAADALRQIGYPNAGREAQQTADAIHRS